MTKPTKRYIIDINDIGLKYRQAIIVWLQQYQYTDTDSVDYLYKDTIQQVMLAMNQTDYMFLTNVTTMLDVTMMSHIPMTQDPASLHQFNQIFVEMAVQLMMTVSLTMQPICTQTSYLVDAVTNTYVIITPLEGP